MEDVKINVIQQESAAVEEEPMADQSGTADAEDGEIVKVEEDADLSTSTCPPPAKRRLVTSDTDGRLLVAVAGDDGDDNKSLAESDDLEFSALSEQERMELGLLSRDGSEFSGPTSSAASMKSFMAMSSSKSTRPIGGISFDEGIMMADQMEETYPFHREPVLKGEKFSTPLAVLYDMAKEFGVKVHFEFHETRTLDEPIRHLVEVYVGNRKGFGEASTRKLASHMAAAHILRKLELTGKYEVPPYYLLPGCRINPQIFSDLSVFCNILEVEQPMFVVQPRDPEVVDAPLHTVKCQIGNLITIGESDSLFLARRRAAKMAFESLTGRPVPVDFVCAGMACMSLIHAKIRAISSEKKAKAKMLRNRSENTKEESEETEVETSSGADGGNNSNAFTRKISGQGVTVESNLEEELDDIFDEGGEQMREFKPDQGTQIRMTRIAKSMTDEVKQKLVGLRISDQTQKKTDDAPAPPEEEGKPTDAPAVAVGDGVKVEVEIEDVVSEEEMENQEQAQVPLTSDTYDWGD